MTESYGKYPWLVLAGLTAASIPLSLMADRYNHPPATHIRPTIESGMVIGNTYYTGGTVETSVALGATRDIIKSRCEYRLLDRVLAQQSTVGKRKNLSFVILGPSRVCDDGEITPSEILYPRDSVVNIMTDDHGSRITSPDITR
jgi:hypothetical protein